MHIELTRCAKKVIITKGNDYIVSKFLLKDKNINIIMLIIGILIYPFGLWGTNIPGNILYQMGLDDIMLLSILFAWIVSLIVVVFSTFRMRNNYKSVIYWIGFALNVIYLVTPGIILIWAFLRLIILGIGH